MYLIVNKYRHSDPQYTAYTDLDEAIRVAREEIKKGLEHHKASKHDVDYSRRLTRTRMRAHLGGRFTIEVLELASETTVPVPPVVTNASELAADNPRVVMPHKADLDKSTDAMHWATELCSAINSKTNGMVQIDVNWVMSWFSNYWGAVHDPMQKRIDNQQRDIDNFCEKIAAGANEVLGLHKLIADKNARLEKLSGFAERSVERMIAPPILSPTMWVSVDTEMPEINADVAVTGEDCIGFAHRGPGQSPSDGEIWFAALGGILRFEPTHWARLPTAATTSSGDGLYEYWKVVAQEHDKTITELRTQITYLERRHDKLNTGDKPPFAIWASVKIMMPDINQSVVVFGEDRVAVARRGFEDKAGQDNSPSEWADVWYAEPASHVLDFEPVCWARLPNPAADKIVLTSKSEIKQKED